MARPGGVGPLGRSTLAGFLAASLAACAAAPQPAAETPPVAPPAHSTRAERVVLVSIDTLRADYVGCYGAAGARTPTLDALARDGVRFETAISPAPLTLPAHATILTGLDPPQHGVHANARFRLDEGIPTLAERFRDGGYATAAFVGAVVLDRRYGLERGFDVYDDEMGFRRTVPGTSSYAERSADQVVDAAVAWLEDAPDRFFLWVHLYDPHANYQPPPGFAPKSSEPPAGLRTAGYGRRFRALLSPFYAGEIHFTDTEVGRLFRILRRHWPDPGTLFVVTSDHGESLGEHGELTHSLTLYDATQRVPLLMAGPGLPSGKLVTSPVRLADLAPTLLALARLPALPASSGVDLQPWIRGERTDPLDAYLETLSTSLDFGWSPVYGLRTERHKYLRSPRPELYDLGSDPGEVRDLAASQPAALRRLDDALQARLAGGRPVRPLEPPEAEERALLQSLGYLVGESPAPHPPLGQVGGPDPKDRVQAFTLIVEADEYRALGRPDRARELLAQAPEAGGWVAHARAELALATGDAEAAERHARQTVAAQPTHAEGYLVLGLALEAQGRNTEARSALTEAVRLDPTKTGALVGLGRLAETAGDREQAESHYREALEGRAPATDAALRLAALRFEAGRSAEADALLAEVEARPHAIAAASPEAVGRVARTEAAAGRSREAVSRLRRWIAAGGDPGALAALAEELDAD